MKRFNILLLLFLMFAGILSSCYEDKGNYDYNWVPEVFVKPDLGGFRDTVIMRGQHLTIIPEVKMIRQYENSRKDTVEFEPERFSYTWTAYLNSIKDPITVLATTRNLDTVINLNINSQAYRVTYSVTEKATGVSWNFNFNLRLETRYANAWLFLTEDENGNADLTLYGKELNNTSEDPWMYEKGVLKRSGFPYLGGGAKFVFYYAKNSRIYVGTGESAGWIGKNDLAWSDKQLIRYQMAVPEDVSFTFEKIIYTRVWHFIASNGAIYPMGNDNLLMNSYNVLPPGVGGQDKYETVRMSPFVGGSSIYNIVYDENNERMYSYTASAASVQTTVKNNLQGKSRLEKHKIFFMQSYLENTVVIAKDKANNKYYKYLYNTNSDKPEIIRTEEILNGQLLEQAEQFVCSWEKGNFYMSVGNDLYVLRDDELKKVNILDEDGVIKEGFNGLDRICLLTRYTDIASTKPYIMVATYSDGTENSGKVYFLQPGAVEPMVLMVKNYHSDMAKVKGISRF